MWENQAGLRLACLERCVPGCTDLDGRSAYKAGDIRKIGRMTIAACSAWLDRRCAGTPSPTLNDVCDIFSSRYPFMKVYFYKVYSMIANYSRE